MIVMKQIFRITAVTIFLLINAFTTYGNDNKSNEEYIMGDISTLPADFSLNITVSTDTGQNTAHENGIPVIDGICTFQVSQNNESNAKASQSFYDISFFEDNKFSRMYKGRSLPFVVKQNYRGIKDGNYRITFVAKDKTGKTGKGSITIQVKH